MNKAELVDAITEKTKITKKDAELAVNGLIDVVEETLEKGEKVTLVGFGTFESKHRAARVGRNPQKPGLEVPIPACKVPVFKAGKEFRDLVRE